MANGLLCEWERNWNETKRCLTCTSRPAAVRPARDAPWRGRTTTEGRAHPDRARGMFQCRSVSEVEHDRVVITVAEGVFVEVVGPEHEAPPWTAWHQPSSLERTVPDDSPTL